MFLLRGAVISSWLCSSSLLLSVIVSVIQFQRALGYLFICFCGIVYGIESDRISDRESRRPGTWGVKTRRGESFLAGN